MDGCAYPIKFQSPPRQCVCRGPRHSQRRIISKLTGKWCKLPPPPPSLRPPTPIDKLNTRHIDTWIDSVSPTTTGLPHGFRGWWWCSWIFILFPAWHGRANRFLNGSPYCISCFLPAQSGSVHVHGVVWWWTLMVYGPSVLFAIGCLRQPGWGDQRDRWSIGRWVDGAACPPLMMIRTCREQMMSISCCDEQQQHERRRTKTVPTLPSSSFICCSTSTFYPAAAATVVHSCRR